MAQTKLFSNLLSNGHLRNGRHTFGSEGCCPLSRRRDLWMRLVEPATNFEEIGVVAAEGGRL